MAPITTHYGISGTVPFLDVNVETDNRWFLDPRAIRLHGDHDSTSDLANRCTESFFDEVLDCLVRGRSHRGLRLLQQFSEPRETRLGMSVGGFNGHGGSDDVGSWIWDALAGDVHALWSVGILKQIEDLPLFIKGVDKDITSDITTRIVYQALTEFTARMVSKYPEFTAAHHTVGKYRRQYWNVDTRNWDSKVFTLPIADGNPLILVPRTWARKTLLMSATRYYETKVLDYAQLERAVRLRSGKLVKTPKDRLHREPGLGRGRVTNLDVTRRAHAQGEDLINKFKRFVDMRWDPEVGSHHDAA